MNDKFWHGAWKKAKEIGVGFVKDMIHIIIALAIFLLLAFILF